MIKVTINWIQIIIHVHNKTEVVITGVVITQVGLDLGLRHLDLGLLESPSGD